MQILPNSSTSDRNEADQSAIEHGWLEPAEYAHSESADRVEIECEQKLAVADHECAQIVYHPHDYPAALVAINLAIEYDPERVNLYYQRALIAKALNDYAQVLADCQQVLNRDPQHQTIRGLYAIALVRTRDYQAALASFDRHIELYPQDPHGYCYRGICYEQLQAHSRALADFNTALELKPGEPVFHHARGRTYQQLGNFSAALADYDFAIQTKQLIAKVDNDSLAEMLCQRAEIQRLQGDYSQAITDCTRSITFNPDHIDAYFRRGIIHAELGDLDLALVDYDQIIMILHSRSVPQAGSGYANDPAHVRTYIQRSWIYFRQGKYTQATQDCESIKTIDRFCFWANYLLGVINTRTGLKHRAIANFTRAIEISPNYISARYHRGVIYYELGNTIEAGADFTEARSIQNQNLEKLIDRDETGFYAEGLALYYTGQIESAITMLKLALLVARRFSNYSFQEQILQLLRHFSNQSDRS
jgi:tetratricopeptide (TPR) repeat protein